jgi:hypothetical protein
MHGTSKKVYLVPQKRKEAKKFAGLTPLPDGICRLNSKS